MFNIFIVLLFRHMTHEHSVLSTLGKNDQVIFAITFSVSVSVVEE